MLEFVETGNEKWLPWARRKLKWLRALRTLLRLPAMSKAFVPESGVLVFMKAQEDGADWIRITGGGFGFLVLKEVDAQTFEGWALKLDAESGLYQPVKTFDSPGGLWTGTLTALEVLEDEGLVPAIMHVTAARRCSRGRGASPQDGRTVPPLPNTSAPVAGYLYRRSGAEETLFEFGNPPAPALYRYNGQLYTFDQLNALYAAGTPAEQDAIVAALGEGPEVPAEEVVSYATTATAVTGRMDATFTPADGWGSGNLRRVVASSSVLATHIRDVRRPEKGSGSTKEFATYAERHRIVAAVRPPADADADYFVQLGGAVSTEDRGWNSNGGAGLPPSGEYVHRTVLGERGVAEYTFVDPSPAPADPVRLSNQHTPPIAFNAALNFYAGVGMSLKPYVVPRAVTLTVEGQAHLLHDDLLASGHGYSFYCYPVPIRIGDAEYWYVNATSVKPAMTHEPGVAWRPTSPATYTYRQVVLRNGELLADTEQTRTCTDIDNRVWASTTAVDILVPMSGCSQGGEDWVCGYAVRQTFGNFDTLPVAAHPFMASADLSRVKVYDTLPQPSVSVDQSALAQDTARRDMYFAAYKSRQFMVYRASTGAAHGAAAGDLESDAVEIVASAARARHRPIA